MSKLPYPLDKGGTHWEGCHRTTHHHNCAVLRCDNHESTITDLRERHEAFVQAVRDAAYEACLFSSGEIHRNELLAIVDGCDAELGKEGK